MELSVHGKQIDVGDSLRGHVKEKIEDLSEKYFNHTTFANDLGPNHLGVSPLDELGEPSSLAKSVAASAARA